MEIYLKIPCSHNARTRVAIMTTREKRHCPNNVHTRKAVMTTSCAVCKQIKDRRLITILIIDSICIGCSQSRMLSLDNWREDSAAIHGMLC